MRMRHNSFTYPVCRENARRPRPSRRRKRFVPNREWSTHNFSLTSIPQREPLRKTFDCLFCQSQGTVRCRFRDGKKGSKNGVFKCYAKAKCDSCRQKFYTKFHCQPPLIPMCLAMMLIVSA
jgi:hypothetical protein